MAIMPKMAHTPNPIPEMVSVADAKNRLSELLGRVAYGDETVIITRHGKPMAMLVRPTGSAEGPSLGDVAGWLDDAHPFFDQVDEIVATRRRHAPRVLGKSSRR